MRDYFNVFLRKRLKQEKIPRRSQIQSSAHLGSNVLIVFNECKIILLELLIVFKLTFLANIKILKNLRTKCYKFLKWL